MSPDADLASEHEGNDEVFDRQFQTYKESYQQRGFSEEEAEQRAALQLQTAEGDQGGSNRDRD